MNSSPSPLQEDLGARQVRRADGLWEGIARVSGMDCGACAVELEHVARQVEGLHEFSVNPASSLARWAASTPQAILQMATRARRLGYSLGSDSTDCSQQQALRNRKAARSRFLRFLVAALCMMQIMMYSAPEYVYSPAEIGIAETGLLRWAQWVLALPLMLYSAAPYFRRAWVAVWQRRLVMDQPIVLGLLLAFALSSLNLNNMSHHVWFDSIAMLLTLLLLVQMGVENQTARALQHLSGLQPDLPLQVEVPDGPLWKSMAVAQLAAGQLYRLNESLAVPVDSELIAEHSEVWVDEAMRTGEVDPVLKKQGDLIQAGSRLLSAEAHLRSVLLAGGDSLTALGQLLLQALAAKPGHQDKVDRLLPWFVLGVLSCALGTLLYWAVYRAQPEVAASATLAVLIVTCPCALALALPLVRLFGIRRLAYQGVLVRNPQALDTLAQVTVVAMDKTGTLTSSDSVQVRHQALAGVPEILDARLLNSICMLARKSAHPVSKAIAAHLFRTLSAQSTPVHWLTFDEVAGAGLSGLFELDGQLVELRLGSVAHCGLVDVKNTDNQTLACCTVNFNPGSLQGLSFSINLQADHALKPQLFALKKRGLSLNLLSGDQPEAVRHWMPDLPFSARLGGLGPEDKTRWIARQQGTQQCVAMVGDGLNDSGAFARADVSFAAAGASTLSAGQADFLLLQPGVAGVLEAFTTARLVEMVGRQNLLWALAYNGIAVPVAAMGFLNPWMASVGMGLSSLLVFFNALRVKQGRG